MESLDGKPLESPQDAPGSTIRPRRALSPVNGQEVPPPRWKPGESGNPGGQARGKKVSTWLAEFGQMDPSDLPDPKSGKLPINARIALARLRKACTDEGLADAAWATDRVEGGVDRTVHLTHKQEPTMSLEDAAAMVKKLEQDAGKAPGEF